MRKIFKRMVAGIAAVLMMGATLMVPVAPVLADEGPSTSIIKVPSGTSPKDSIEWLLKLILNILVYGLGAAAILGVIIVGIQYMTARDNEQQATQAKKRLFEIVIGLVAWAVMFAVLNWLIPGGFSLS